MFCPSIEIENSEFKENQSLKGKGGAISVSNVYT